MKFIDKVKNAFSMSEEEYLDDVDVEEDEEEEEEYVYQKPRTSRLSKQPEPAVKPDNVVDIHSSSAGSAASYPSKAHVVFKKLDNFDEVDSVADVLIDQRIVILNLETCDEEASRRILDVLSGVAYAKDGTIRRVAGKAYIITPCNVPLSGELLGEVANSAANNSIF